MTLTRHRPTYKHMAALAALLLTSLTLQAQDSPTLSTPKAQAHRERAEAAKETIKAATQADETAAEAADTTLTTSAGEDIKADKTAAGAQSPLGKAISAKDKEMQAAVDTTLNAAPAITIAADTTSASLAISDKTRWIPDPKKALWLAIAFPGGGQIYNRKYWKLPLIYGGFIGCVYALNWNNTMYRDYSQAYVDIMDDDPNTQSYKNFLPPSYNVDQNLTRIQDLFRRKKNYYRRYRDLSLFCMIGVYALSIIDAYVDAELSSFDISPELSMKVKPTVINDSQRIRSAADLQSSSYGVQCSLSF